MPASSPADAVLAELDGVAAAAREPDVVLEALAAGSASLDVARRVACEAYHVARWTTPELALLVANAPDVYAFTMDDAAHYRHWAHDLARRTGYLRDGGAPITLAMCAALGVDAGAVRAYQPIPETIAAAFTLVYYVRRSYEEALAAVACGWDPAADGVVAALRWRYGAVADAPAADAPSARELLRAVSLTDAARARCREAVRNVALVRATRVRAMNRWLAA